MLESWAAALESGSYRVGQQDKWKVGQLGKKLAGEWSQVDHVVAA
jgi:hypothetical protein